MTSKDLEKIKIKIKFGGGGVFQYLSCLLIYLIIYYYLLGGRKIGLYFSNLLGEWEDKVSGEIKQGVKIIALIRILRYMPTFSLGPPLATQ